LPDLIITGTPRSGTSLAAAVIDQAPGCLCLSEPESHVRLMQNAVSAADFVAEIGQDFDTVRRSILAGGSVLDRRDANGAPITNYFTDPERDRQREARYTVRPITRPGLPADFVLGIKHVALYGAVLPELVQAGRYRLIALVRDPVALLMSWRSLDLPISRGRLPAGERFWPELRSLGEAELELTEKQIRICDLLFCRFLGWAGRVAILRYEDLVADPTRLLRAAGVTEIGSVPASALISKNAPPAADDERMGLAERIRRLAAAGKLPAISECYPYYASGH
jgi:hypothetical protein